MRDSKWTQIYHDFGVDEEGKFGFAYIRLIPDFFHSDHGIPITATRFIYRSREESDEAERKANELADEIDCYFERLMRNWYRDQLEKRKSKKHVNR